MSRTAQGLLLAGGVALLLVVLIAGPGGATPIRGPGTCFVIGQPVGGGGTISCVTVGPHPPPPPTTRPSPPPPPPTVAPPPVPRPPVAQPPAPRPAVVVVPVTTVPTTSPPRPPATPPPTTVPAAIPAGALAAPVNVAAERDKERRWGLTAVVLLIGGGAAAARMRSRSQSR